VPSPPEVRAQQRVARVHPGRPVQVGQAASRFGASLNCAAPLRRLKLSIGAVRFMSTQAIQDAAGRYRHLMNEFRPGDAAPIDFHLFRGALVLPATAGVLELQDAEILSGEWFVIAGVQVYGDLLLQTPSPPLQAYRVQKNANVIELLYEPPLRLSVPEAFLLGGCQNYSHWLLDFLPRMRLYPNSAPPLIVNKPLLGFQLDSLKLLGIEPSNLVPLDYPRSYLVPKLLYPCTLSSVATPPLSFDVSILGWLRDAFGRLFAPEPRRRKLFISRAGHPLARGRRLLNEGELAKIAAARGFEIVRCEDLSFADQVNLFSQAAVITGPHGAGFANMVFAPRQARIIELIGPRYARDTSGGSLPFLKMVVPLGQQFSRIVGVGDDTSAIEMDHLPYETYTIDPEAFARALDA
jgi:hypothetical protein